MILRVVMGDYAAEAAGLSIDEFPHLLGMSRLIHEASEIRDYRETAIRVLSGGVRAAAASVGSSR